MYQPGSLSLEMVQLFMISQGGKVPNHELVKQFKSYLNNTENKGKLGLCYSLHSNTLHKDYTGSRFYPRALALINLFPFLIYLF